MSMNLGMTSKVEFNRALRMLEDITETAKSKGKGNTVVGLLNGRVVTKAGDPDDHALQNQLTRIAQALADNAWPEKGAVAERLNNEKNRANFMNEVREMLGIPKNATDDTELPDIKLSQLRTFADKMTSTLKSQGLATKHTDSFEDELGFTTEDMESANLDAEFEGLLNSAETLKEERKDAAAKLWDLEIALTRETGKGIPAKLKEEYLKRITAGGTTKEMLKIIADGFSDGNIDPFAVGQGERKIDMPAEMKARFLNDLNTNSSGHQKDLAEAIGRTIVDLPRGWTITFEGEQLPNVSTKIDDRAESSKELLKIINKTFRDGEEDFRLQFLQMCASQYVDGMIFGSGELMMGKLPGGVLPNTHKEVQHTIDVRRVDDNTVKVHYHSHVGKIFAVITKNTNMDPKGNPPIALENPEDSYVDKDYVITWRRNEKGEWIADCDDGMTVKYNFSKALTKDQLITRTVRAFKGYITNDRANVLKHVNETLKNRISMDQAQEIDEDTLNELLDRIENDEKVQKIYLGEVNKTVFGASWGTAGDYSIEALGSILARTFELSNNPEANV